MNTSLVTGGAGFIGAHVTNHLIESGHRVVVLDDLSGGFLENVNPKAVFVRGSVTDHDLISSIFTQYKFDYIFHLAAYAAEGLSHFIRRFNYENNLIGSINLINNSVINKVKCFVFASSIALPMHEGQKPEPEDPYGIAKYAVELDLKAAREMFGLNYIIFRPHNVYGEYQNIGDRYRNVIGIFMNQLLQGKSLTIFGDGSQTRAFSYIKDVAPYIANSINILEAYNEIINIGGDKEYSVLELAKSVMAVMKIEQEITFHSPRNEVLHAYSDHSKAKDTFKLKDENFVSLNEGLKKMAMWVKSAGARSSNEFSNIEIKEKLPTAWTQNNSH